MDRTMQNKGGCTIITFYNGSLPFLGVFASKTSQSSTMIAGSSVIVKMILAHFQFSTVANSVDREKLRLKTVCFMKVVKGKIHTIL